MNVHGTKGTWQYGGKPQTQPSHVQWSFEGSLRSKYKCWDWEFKICTHIGSLQSAVECVKSKMCGCMLNFCLPLPWTHVCIGIVTATNHKARYKMNLQPWEWSVIWGSGHVNELYAPISNFLYYKRCLRERGLLVGGRKWAKKWDTFPSSLLAYFLLSTLSGTQ